MPRVMNGQEGLKGLFQTYYLRRITTGKKRMISWKHVCSKFNGQSPRNQPPQKWRSKGLQWKSWAMVGLQWSHGVLSSPNGPSSLEARGLSLYTCTLSSRCPLASPGGWGGLALNMQLPVVFPLLAFPATGRNIYLHVRKMGLDGIPQHPLHSELHMSKTRLLSKSIFHCRY